MGKNTIIVVLTTLLSKIIGLGRELTLSYAYGATSITDAFLISITIPTVIIELFIQGIKSIYIPQYNVIETENGTEKADRHTSNVINIITVTIVILIIISIIFMEPIIKVFASGFSEELTNLTVKFTRISVVSALFIFITRILSSYLNNKSSFFISSAVGIPHTFIMILALIISQKINILILPIGIVIASFIQMYILVIQVKKKGYKHKFFFDVKDKNFVKMISLSFPVIMGISVNEINVLIDRTMASRVAEGGISALTYARYLNDFILAIFVLSLASVIFPQISKIASKNNMEELKYMLKKSVTFINLFLIPATIGFMVFSDNIVQLVYQRGAFDNQALRLTSSALFFYSIGLLGVSLRTLLSKFYFSLGDTRTPNQTAIIGLFINIFFNVILSKYIGIGGLALASSISAIATTSLLLYFLNRKIGNFGLRSLTIDSLKIITVSFIMAFVVSICYQRIILVVSPSISLIISIIIGVFVYSIGILFVKLEEVDLLINVVKNRINSMKK